MLWPMPPTTRILLATLILGCLTQVRAGDVGGSIDALLAGIPAGGVAGVAMAQLTKASDRLKRSGTEMRPPSSSSYGYVSR